MKHLLFLIVAAAIYFHYYPNDQVTKLYNEQKQNFLGVFSEFGDTKVKLKSDKILVDLKSKLNKFSDAELEHLEYIASSRENVKEFYYSICKTEKRDIVFHIYNERSVCSVISKYTNML